MKSMKTENTALESVGVEVSPPEIAFKWRYHEMTSREMGADLRKRIEKIPAQTFADMQVGATYLYRPGYGSDQVFVCLNVTPSRKQADVRNLNKNGSVDFRIHSASYRGTFLKLTPNGISKLLGVTHVSIVKEALLRKFDVPVPVRREYPHLFADIPERFERNLNCETKADRVRRACESHFGKTNTVADFEAIIVSHHKSIRELIEESVRMIYLNPKLESDYRTYINDHKDSIDFYRWLIPYVSPGGVFCVEKEN